ncbi:MAG: TrkA family potassium uptake protein [Caldilineaceae bacterium]
MRIIIVGCGRWGAGLAQKLDQIGHEITVVDQDPDNFGRLGSSFKGNKTEGIGFDREVLLAAGIERADGLAATTPSDEVNFVTARIAREVFRVPHVIARIYDPLKADLCRQLGLNAVTPAIWGVNRAAELLCYSPLEAVASLGNGEVEIMDVEIPEMLVGRSLHELVVPGEIHIVALTRSGKMSLPTLGTRLQRGDQLYLSVLNSSTERLKSILGHEVTG